MTLDPAAGPLLTAAGLLVAAGATKVIRPHDTARAMRDAGLPVGPALVRAVALVEVGIGLTAATVGGAVPALLVCASYLSFALFVALAMGRGWSLSSCGCFGEPDTPPTSIHVGVDLLLAVGAGAAFVRGQSQAPLDFAVHRPAVGTALVVLSAVTAGLAYLALARLPRLRSRS